MNYSKGIFWLDDCRIPFVDEGDKSYGIENKKQQKIYGGGKGLMRGEYNANTQGRFTPNLLVCDDMLNDGTITSIKQNKNYTPPNEPNSVVGFSRGKYSGINDKGTNSRYYNLDLWFDKMLEKL